MRYLKAVPRKPLPQGEVIVHNRVKPARRGGTRGFRFWAQGFDAARLEVCHCGWAGVTHYRIRPDKAQRAEEPP